MTWDEYVAAGLCECGRSLDTHPPLRKQRPLTSWKSQRPVPFATGTVSGRTWTVAARASHERNAA